MRRQTKKDKEIKDLKNKNGELQKNYSKFYKGYFDLKKKYDIVLDECEDYKSHCAKLESNNKKMNREVDKAKRDAEKVRSEYGKIKKKCLKLEKDSKKRGEIEKLNEVVKSLKVKLLNSREERLRDIERVKIDCDRKSTTYLNKCKNAESQIQVLETHISTIKKELKNTETSYSKAFMKLEESTKIYRELLKDMKEMIKEYEVLAEKYKSNQPLPVILAHDSTMETSSHYSYTKKLADYIFRSKEPLQGNLDFTKFQVCSYSDRLFRENPNARFDVCLYFILASGGRHAVGNRDLFVNLKNRCDKMYIIACRAKARYGIKEDTSEDPKFEFQKGISCLNFLMKSCEILENEHNEDILGRIHDRLPEPPVIVDTTWYQKYKIMEVRQFVNTLSKYKSHIPVLSMTTTKSSFSRMEYDDDEAIHHSYDQNNQKRKIEMGAGMTSSTRRAGGSNSGRRRKEGSSDDDDEEEEGFDHDDIYNLQMKSQKLEKEISEQRREGNRNRKLFLDDHQHGTGSSKYNRDEDDDDELFKTPNVFRNDVTFDDYLKKQQKQKKNIERRREEFYQKEDLKGKSYTGVARGKGTDKDVRLKDNYNYYQ